MLPLLLILLQQGADLSREASREVGRQECATVDKSEIVICARRGRSPYRLPEPPPHFDPFGDTPSVMAEREAWAEEGDTTGTRSCSAVGPMGYEGCMLKTFKQQRDQTQWGKNIPKGR